ncbi:MAG TPA: hypothetical protein DIC35_04100 [Candidatus Moranbacteria bacterium]|nr:hypothetical protein [Candidatus Moranbacteria bacterium]
MKTISILIFAWSILLGWTGSAFAQNESNGFSITPFLKEINVFKDQKEEDFFLEIENNSNLPADVKLSVTDFGSMNETGGILFLDYGKEMNSKYSLAPWIELEKNPFLLEAGGKKSIAVKVINADSLSPGGRYGVILANFESISPEKNGRNNAIGDIKLNSKITSLVFLRKEGGAAYNLQLEKKEKEISLFSLPDSIRLYFENKGNIHLSARGLVSISDPFGREVLRGIINNESRIILPESSKAFPVDLKQNLAAFIPGKYRLSVQYRYDGKDDFDIDEEYFLFFPPESTAILTIILVAASGIIFRWRWKRKNNCG